MAVFIVVVLNAILRFYRFSLLSYLSFNLDGASIYLPMAVFAAQVAARAAGRA